MTPPWWAVALGGSTNPARWPLWVHRATAFRWYVLKEPDTSRWPREAHVATSWKLHRQPAPDLVITFKDRTLPAASGQRVRWPLLFASLRIGPTIYHRANYMGVGAGTAMQNGARPVNGVRQSRIVTWGYAVWGQREVARAVPLPALGWYWRTGYPTPSYDKRCIIVDAVGGMVHELIQFDPDAPYRADTPANRLLPNQALGWGAWRDGKLVDGRATTAARAPVHAYCWTPLSAQAPHVQGLVLPDYIGGDGALTDSTFLGYDTPRLDQRYVLDPDSDSFRNMVALGGECAARAQALAEWGCRVIDRSGYADADGSSKRVGTRPYDPTLHTQSGDWGQSNIESFTIALSDLLLVS